MRRCHALVLVTMTCLTSCAAPSFRLSEDSAMDRLMATRHVAQLQREHVSSLTCFVENSGADGVDLYLGENHPTHTVRVGSYRVTTDGGVWMNSDATQLEERWVRVN